MRWQDEVQGDQEGALHSEYGDAGGDGAAPPIRRHLHDGRILNRSPVVWDFLIVQMPDARYVGRVPLTLRPGDGLCLGLECLEHAIPLFLDDIVYDSGPFPPAFGAGLNEDCRHVSLPDCCRSRRALHKAKGSNSCERPAGGLSAPPGAPLGAILVDAQVLERGFFINPRCGSAATRWAVRAERKSAVEPRARPDAPRQDRGLCRFAPPPPRSRP